MKPQVRLAALPALVMAMVGGYLFVYNDGAPSVHVAVWGWLVAAFSVPLAIQFPWLSAQLFVRAILWASMLLGVFLALLVFDKGGAALVISAGVALLMLDSSLDSSPGGLVASMPANGPGLIPIALRPLLVPIAVMAMANTFFVLFLGGVFAELLGHWRYLAPGVVMLVPVVGLLRFETWGLLLNLIANTAIAFGV